MAPRPRYLSWLLQAESDLRAVAALSGSGLHAQACFNAQQSAEKALKALAFFRGADLFKSHSLQSIAADLAINGQLASFANKLDLYYLTARYPDALPDHAVPAESFDHVMADEALTMAKAFIDRVKNEIGAP